MCRIFHLRFNERELVQEIYFLRQLSHDEAARKVDFIADCFCQNSYFLHALASLDYQSAL